MKIWTDLEICQQERANAYPTLGDFADALYWKEKGDDSKWIAWLAAVAAVKEKYPKPGGD